MAMLAEQLVEEWLNRDGFFTIRGLRLGVDEIDVLAIRPRNGKIEARHIEVQVSFRPISYIGKLTEKEQKKLGRKSANSTGSRPDSILKAGIEAWVLKKFHSEKKTKMREHVLPGANWSFELVHAVLYEPKELDHLKAAGVKLVPFKKVLAAVCDDSSKLKAGAGADIAEVVRYFRPKTK